MKSFPLKRSGSKAIAEIQPSRMAALAEIVESLARQMCVFKRNWFDPDTHASKECIALLQHLKRELTFNYNREFDEVTGGHAAAWSTAESLDVEFGIRLLGKDRNYR